MFAYSCWARHLYSFLGTTCYVADFGIEHAVPIDGLDSNAIASKLEDLVKKGENMPR